MVTQCAISNYGRQVDTICLSLLSCTYTNKTKITKVAQINQTRKFYTEHHQNRIERQHERKKTLATTL